MEKKKFWQYSWLMWVAFFILPPIGIALMWINKKFNKAVRVILTVVFGIYAIIYFSIIFVKTPETTTEQDINTTTIENQSKEDIETEVTETEDAETETTENESTHSEDGMRITHDQAMGKLKLEVAHSFAPNYTVEYVNDEKDVLITLWFEDYTKEVCESEKDDTETINELISTYENVCQTYEDYWNDEGYKYGTVTLKIVDINDKETVLFSFYSGVCEYAITD